MKCFKTPFNCYGFVVPGLNKELSDVIYCAVYFSLYTTLVIFLRFFVRPNWELNSCYQLPRIQPLFNEAGNVEFVVVRKINCLWFVLCFLRRNLSQLIVRSICSIQIVSGVGLVLFLIEIALLIWLKFQSIYLTGNEGTADATAQPVLNESKYQAIS